MEPAVSPHDGVGVLEEGKHA